MNDTELIKQIETLREKLNRSMRRVEGLRQKSKLLETQCVDAKDREKYSNELVMELLERQRELSVMLNRANIMLNRAHETMALTSVEFNEITKALPEPKRVEMSDRIAKINDLFKKSGASDAELLGTEASDTPSLDTDELKRESQAAFKKDSIWTRTERPTPPTVEAELLDENHQMSPTGEIPEHQAEIMMVDGSNADSTDEVSEVETENGKRTWWQWIAAGGKSEMA